MIPSAPVQSLLMNYEQYSQTTGLHILNLTKKIELLYTDLQSSRSTAHRDKIASFGIGHDNVVTEKWNDQNVNKRELFILPQAGRRVQIKISANR